jgi:hypothetical protein
MADLDPTASPEAEAAYRKAQMDFLAAMGAPGFMGVIFKEDGNYSIVAAGKGVITGHQQRTWAGLLDLLKQVMTQVAGCELDGSMETHGDLHMVPVTKQ